ncbi:CDC6 [Candida jiufengensis]|uniref:CDC6 n=1 Tax=Candida jiufengensis TaxID=497108 RepID=UPI002225612B|nr:CDC6 [Candida jiufengensis]KAI5954683.1 CDC6 [Candida jiufengensis]
MSSSITPISTPTKKRTIRDISNTYQNSSSQYNKDILLTPTKTPNKKQKLSNILKDNDLSCKKKLIFTPTTPIKTIEKPLLTPSSSSKSITTTIYSQTKNLFQRGYDNTNNKLYNDEKINLSLTSREEEAKTINNFLNENIQLNLCNNLYISGPPGTGKTAQINLSLKKYESSNSIKIIKINCMTLKNPESIFHEIYSQLIGKLSISFITKRKYEDIINEINSQQNINFKTIILILDEIDFLISNGNYQILLKLFQLANFNDQNQLKSKILLIGISNTLDLNNKFLPKLSLNNINLNTLQFLPYTAQQIKYIIENKLSILNQNIFHPIALQFCCQKAASISGDLRRAFDLCYKSIELVEKEYKNNNKSEISKIMISHVAKICSEAFNTNSNNNNINIINSLNTLQQLILCHLFNYKLILQNQNLQNLTKINVQSFYDYYLKQNELNKKILMINSIKMGEFLEILNALESNNCINIIITNKKNNNNLKFITLNIDYNDILKSIGNNEILKKLLKRS